MTKARNLSTVLTTFIKISYGLAQAYCFSGHNRFSRQLPTNRQNPGFSQFNQIGITIAFLKTIFAQLFLFFLPNQSGTWINITLVNRLFYSQRPFLSGF